MGKERLSNESYRTGLYNAKTRIRYAIHTRGNVLCPIVFLVMNEANLMLAALARHIARQTAVERMLKLPWIGDWMKWGWKNK